MQAVVLAAGIGTRLRPITETRSKAMVPVAGRPLVEHVMAVLAETPIDEWLLVVGPEDADIRRHFSGRTSVSGRIRLVVQEERRGMAHALGLAAHAIRGPFLLSACDSIPERGHVHELAEALRGADAALSLAEVARDAIARSAAVVVEDGLVTRIVEKPRPEETPSLVASLPLYAFAPALLAHLEDVRPSPRGELELQDAIAALIESGSRVAGVTTAGRRQVTTPEDLLRLNLDSLAEDPHAAQVAPGILDQATRTRPPLRVERGCRVGIDCDLGPGAFLEAGCQVGAGATVRRAVVLRGATVPEGAVVEGSILTPEPSVLVQ